MNWILLEGELCLFFSMNFGDRLKSTLGGGSSLLQGNMSDFLPFFFGNYDLALTSSLSVGVYVLCIS